MECEPELNVQVGRILEIFMTGIGYALMDTTSFSERYEMVSMIKGGWTRIIPEIFSQSSFSI